VTDLYPSVITSNTLDPLYLKEYAQAEGVSVGSGVDLESASDLSHGIGVSETAKCWEKVQRTSARPHVDLVPGGNGTGTCLMRADVTARNMPQEFGFQSLLWLLPCFPLTLD
jgi:hypothetical protein